MNISGPYASIPPRRLSGCNMGNTSTRWHRVVCNVCPNMFQTIWRCYSAYAIDELSHQIIMVRPPLIAMHSSRLGTALAAAQAASLSPERVVTYNGSSQMTAEILVQDRLRSKVSFMRESYRRERRERNLCSSAFQVVWWWKKDATPVPVLYANWNWKRPPAFRSR